MSSRWNLIRPLAKPSWSLGGQVLGKRNLTQAEAILYCSREETENLKALPTYSFMEPFFLQFSNWSLRVQTVQLEKSVSQHLLIIYYVPGTLLSFGDTVENQLDKATAHRSFHSMMEGKIWTNTSK